MLFQDEGERRISLSPQFPWKHFRFEWCSNAHDTMECVQSVGYNINILSKLIACFEFVQNDVRCALCRRSHEFTLRSYEAVRSTSCDCERNASIFLPTSDSRKLLHTTENGIGMEMGWSCVDTSGFFSEPIYCAITQMKFQRKHVQISCAFFPSAVSFCSKGIRNCLLLGKQINANAFHSCLQSVTIIMFECIYRLRVWNVSPAVISKHWHYGIWVTGRKHIDEKKIWS